MFLNQSLIISEPNCISHWQLPIIQCFYIEYSTQNIMPPLFTVSTKKNVLSLLKRQKVRCDFQNLCLWCSHWNLTNRLYQAKTQSQFILYRFCFRCIKRIKISRASHKTTFWKHISINCSHYHMLKNKISSTRLTQNTRMFHFLCSGLFLP